MAKKPRMSPRKVPLQSRSKATVDAILTATAGLLRRHGYDQLSTNKVAQTAGVSVGSLYQYFPSKESLVLAVMDQYCGHVSQTLEARLIGLGQSSIEVVAHALVEEMIAMHRQDPKLHRALLQEMPRLDASSGIRQLQQRFADLLVVYLEAHRDEIEVDDVRLAAYLLTVSVDSITHDAVMTESELLDSRDFTRQIVRMVLCYLAPSRATQFANRRSGAASPARASRSAAG